MEQKHILLVEDNPIDQSIVTAALRQHRVSVADNIERARQLLTHENVGLVILDVNLPDGDGFRFFQEIQKRSPSLSVPVVFLTSKVDINERVFGLNLGAQDYICKPVDPSELQARVDARLRAAAQVQPIENYQKGDLNFNLSLRQLTIAKPPQDPSRIDLTTLEFNVLYYFARHEEHVLTREQLLDEVWGRKSHEVTDRSVDSLISGLRKKIGASDYQLRAVYGSGYALVKKDGNL